MSDLRVVGLLASLAMLGFVWWKHRHRGISHAFALLGTTIAGCLAAASVRPSLLNGVTRLFQVQTRLMALSILATIALFALLLYALKELARLRGQVGDLVRALAREEFQRIHAGTTSSGIAIVIPAYNEATSLATLLPSLPVEVCGLPVRAMVVVDGARDGSAEIARECAIPVTSHAINRGQGDALRTGFELALQGGAEIVVTMDADGQHRPDEIERLVQPLVAGEADFVLGSRFAGQYADRGGARHLGIVGFSALISLLTGLRVSDCTNGFRAIRAADLARFQLTENRFNAPELLIEAACKGLRFREVPVTVMSRTEGESKKPRSWRYPFGFARVMIKTWLRV